MDLQANRTKISGTDCHVCGHFGTPQCDSAADPGLTCRAFLSWSDLWQREMAAIKRAQRATYLLAGAAAIVAVLIMILPSLLG